MLSIAINLIKKKNLSPKQNTIEKLKKKNENKAKSVNKYMCLR